MHYAPYYSGAAPLRDRLADLIEPAYDHFVESDEKVDREALLELADKLECDGECDGCDMSDGIWCDAQGYAARRIREALGEVE